MSKTYEFLKSAGPFFVATNNGDQPHVRAFTAVAEFNGKLCIGTSKNKNVYKQLLSNPKVELCSVAPDRRWVRVEGEVSLVDSDEACQAMLDANPMLQRMYNPNDNLMAVFSFTKGTATFSSFTEAPEVEKL